MTEGALTHPYLPGRTDQPAARIQEPSTFEEGGERTRAIGTHVPQHEIAPCMTRIAKNDAVEASLLLRCTERRTTRRFAIERVTEN